MKNTKAGLAGMVALMAACGLDARTVQAATCNQNPASACGTDSITNSTGYSTIPGGLNNTITSNYCVIAGGSYNGAASPFGAIGGGHSNIVQSNSDYSMIDGGVNNQIYTYAPYSSIGGGSYNTIYGGSGMAQAYNGTIGGGTSNYLGFTASYACIGGGSSNTIDAPGATIAGGLVNDVTGTAAFIGGGVQNTASGYASVVAGGYQNIASGSTSFAAGNLAHADQDGCFVFSDSTACGQSCVVNNAAAPNAFVVRSSGGVQFVTDTGGCTSNKGVYMLANTSGWVNTSDRNQKDGFLDVDARSVLLRVAAMPVTTWMWKGDTTGSRHMGPMAQDFYAAFQLGTDERHITDIDEAGVAFAAIQGLYAEVLQRDEAIRGLNARIEALEKTNADANGRAAALERVNSALERANVEANLRAASLEKRLEQIEARLGLKK